MERGMRALLSPNEETALRHVATGLAHPTSSKTGHIERLKKLGLVTEDDGLLRLTETGRARYATLPKAEPLYKAGSGDKVNQALTEYFRSARR